MKRRRNRKGQFTKGSSGSPRRRRKRSSSRRRKRKAVFAANPPRRRRKRRSAPARRRRRRSASVFALNPRRRRSSRRRRRGFRRNPGDGISIKTIALAGLIGTMTYVGSSVLLPRVIPNEIKGSPMLYGGALSVIGLGLGYVLRNHPAAALGVAVPLLGAGGLVMATKFLTPAQPQPAPQVGPAPAGGGNLGLVTLNDAMGLVRDRPMGLVRDRSMGAVEGLVGTGDYSRRRAPALALAVGAT